MVIESPEKVAILRMNRTLLTGEADAGLPAGVNVSGLAPGVFGIDTAEAHYANKMEFSSSFTSDFTC